VPGAASPPPTAVIRAAYVRGFTYALKLTRRKARADELVQSAMVAALDGPTAWDPATHPAFDSHVCNLIWSHYGNASQSYEATHSEGALTDAHENRRTEALLDPEETLLDSAQESLAAQRTEALDTRVADDPPVRLLRDASDAGEDSTARALAAGYSAREIEFARRRLARHIEAVMREFPTPSEDD
jgi:DNA-directed RNA polymerase specialized sigma24 family protein